MHQWPKKTVSVYFWQFLLLHQEVRAAINLKDFGTVSSMNSNPLVSFMKTKEEGRRVCQAHTTYENTQYLFVRSNNLEAILHGTACYFRIIHGLSDSVP